MLLIQTIKHEIHPKKKIADESEFNPKIVHFFSK